MGKQANDNLLEESGGQEGERTKDLVIRKSGS